jgi:hypothetical protein
METSPTPPTNQPTARRRQYLIVDIVRSGLLGLNMTQSALLAYLYTRLAMTEAPVQLGPDYYYLCDEQPAIDAVPMLPRKRDTVRRLIKEFETLGVLRLTTIGEHLYFTPAPILRSWGYDYNPEEDVTFSALSEKNPNLGKKSEPRKKIRTSENFAENSENFPTPTIYKNNNIENNNILVCSRTQDARAHEREGVVSVKEEAAEATATPTDATADTLAEPIPTPTAKEPRKKAARREADARKSIFRHSDLARLVTATPDGGLDFSSFSEAFPDDLRREADLGYYFRAVLNWSDMNDTRVLRTERGWAATVRQFITRDRDRGQLHRPAGQVTQATRDMLQFMEDTRLD